MSATAAMWSSIVRVGDIGACGCAEKAGASNVEFAVGSIIDSDIDALGVDSIHSITVGVKVIGALIGVSM